MAFSALDISCLLSPLEARVRNLWSDMLKVRMRIQGHPNGRSSRSAISWWDGVFERAKSSDGRKELESPWAKIWAAPSILCNLD